MANLNEAFNTPIDLNKEQIKKKLEQNLKPITISVINDMNFVIFPIFCPVCRPGKISQTSNDGHRQQHCNECNQDINMIDHYIQINGMLYLKD